MALFLYSLPFLILIFLPTDSLTQTIREAVQLGGNPVIRVLLFSGSDSLAIRSTRSFSWQTTVGLRTVDSGQVLIMLHRKNEIRVRFPGGFLQISDSVEVYPPDSSGHVNAKGSDWRGALVIKSDSSGLKVINRIPLEDYLLSVIPAEIGMGRKSDEMEAVRVQAIIARTFTVQRVISGRKKRSDWDLTATMADQVYEGVQSEVPGYQSVIRETHGLVVVSDSVLIQALYHSTCGGRTNDPFTVWGNAKFSYLQPVICGENGQPACQISPFFSWKRILDENQVRKNLSGAIPSAYRNKISRSDSVLSDGGYLIPTVLPESHSLVSELAFYTDNGTYTVRGDAIRWVFRDSTGRLLPSLKFKTNHDSDDSGKRILIFEGIGYGHGVGLCQWGAISASKSGKKYPEIIKSYYSNSEIIRLSAHSYE